MTALSHRIEAGILRIVVEGPYGDDDLRAVMIAAFDDEAFRPGLDLLIDSRNTDAAPDRHELIDRIDLMREAKIGSRCALVVSGSLHFGLGRMFSSFAEPEGFEIRVFRDLAEAERWLGCPPRS